MSLFVAGLFFSPSTVERTEIRKQQSILNEDSMIQHDTARVLPGRVRVALYNSTNWTTPSYALGSMNTNYSAVYNLLVDAGFDVTPLVSSDIANYELQPSAYDVLVLADNVPRENETKLVKEFWLGGGGVLSIDSVASYLCYEGILPREAEGTDGQPDYFTYVINDIDNVTARHPATQAYQIGDSLSKQSADWAAYNWTALQGTSIADDLTRLTADDDNDEWAFAVASDASDRGGRVVHIGIPMNPYSTDFDELIVDAVEWMCPRPKGRVAFDYSHKPYYSVDPWDSYANTYGRYEELRDDIVSRGLTFDKLHPSPDGNLTESRLEPFDVLITVLPMLNYTAAEVSAVQSWTSSGGGLYAFGDRWVSILIEYNQNLNYILSPYDVSIFETGDGGGIITGHGTHPTVEDCTSLDVGASGFVNVTDDAVSVWWEAGDTYAGADIHNSGRIMLVSDINFADDFNIDDESNRKFTLNVINWLASDDADVLIFTNEPTAEQITTGKSIHALESSVALAANELGIPYMIHETISYFNRSLYEQAWKLVVIDAPWGFAADYLDDFEWYVDSGGRLLMNWYHMTATPSHTLYPKLGINYAGDLADPTPVYMWDFDHPVFNIPLEYGASNYSGPRDYGSTGDLLQVYDNATALAGITAAPEDSKATLVLRNDGKTLYNSYLTSQYSADTDDSTYEDRLEVWINELALMYRPFIDEPSDIVMELGTTGQNIVWNPSSYRPDSYVIEEDGLTVDSGAWNGGSISYSLDGYDVGTFVFTIEVVDHFGETSSDTVTVVVEDTTAPVLSSASDMEYTEGETGNFANWTATDLDPDVWELFINGTSHDTGAWTNGSDILINVDGLDVGVYNLTLLVWDESGNSATDTLILTVLEETTTTTTTTTDTLPGGLSLPILLALVGIAAIIVISLIVIIRRR